MQNHKEDCPQKNQEYLKLTPGETAKYARRLLQEARAALELNPEFQNRISHNYFHKRTNTPPDTTAVFQYKDAIYEISYENTESKKTIRILKSRERKRLNISEEFAEISLEPVSDSSDTSIGHVLHGTKSTEDNSIALYSNDYYAVKNTQQLIKELRTMSHK